MDLSGLFKNIAPSLGQLLGQFGSNATDSWKNPANASMQSLQNAPQMMKPYFEPYMQAGQAALPGMQNLYKDVLNDPAGLMNKFGQSYQQSPGYDFALKQALQASDHAAAAGGMAGSPQHETQNMATAVGLADQDYNNWLSNALGLYQGGLAGQGNIYNNLYNTGYGASHDLGESIGNNQLSQALLQYQAQNAQNQHEGEKNNSIWGTLGSLAASALPFLF